MSTGLAFVGFLALVGGALWLMLRPPSRATISAATIPAVLAAMAAMAASATVVAEEEETVVEAVLRSDLDSTTLAIVVLLGVAAVGGLILCILMPGQPRHPVEQSINDQVASKQWAGGLDQAPPPHTAVRMVDRVLARHSPEVRTGCEASSHARNPDRV